MLLLLLLLSVLPPSPSPLQWLGVALAVNVAILAITPPPHVVAHFFARMVSSFGAIRDGVGGDRAVMLPVLVLLPEIVCPGTMFRPTFDKLEQLETNLLGRFAAIVFRLDYSATELVRINRRRQLLIFPRAPGSLAPFVSTVHELGGEPMCDLGTSKAAFHLELSVAISSFSFFLTMAFITIMLFHRFLDCDRV